MPIGFLTVEQRRSHGRFNAEPAVCRIFSLRKNPWNGGRRHSVGCD